jgi:hypothetical protein
MSASLPKLALSGLSSASFAIGQGSEIRVRKTCEQLAAQPNRCLNRY